MRSIFAKLLVWSLGLFAISLVAYWGIWRSLERKGPGDRDPMHRIHAKIEDDVCRAYEAGGPERLAIELRKLDEYLPGEHLLTDERGRDLVTGADRSDLLRPGHRSDGPPRLADGRLILIPPRRNGGSHCRLIALVPPWFDPPNILPYFAAIILLIASTGALFAGHLAAPLRNLRRVMDRFGRGDLAARVGSTRSDEIGELSRAFDEMAGRIETLLDAERRLLQDVSHELRSPLARLEVAVDLASTSDDPWASIDRIKRDIGRLSVLVNELLQLTRAEGDPACLDDQKVAIDQLLGELIENCAIEAEAKACELRLRIDSIAQIEGSRELIHRAVENVVRNAIRHAPEATTIDVLLESAAPFARIVVRDRGPGVPDEHLAAIFEPFFRVEGDRSRASGGVGLGLAIARRAVELHRGRISARNGNPGLLVTIELPIAPVQGIARPL